VQVRQHRPEPPHLLRRHVDPEGGEVALDEGPCVGLQPVPARSVRALQKSLRVATTKPERRKAAPGMPPLDLIPPERRKIEEGGAAGEGLRDAADEPG